MKVFKTSIQPSAHELCVQMEQQLNPMFQDKIQRDVKMVITENGNTIEVGQPELYQSFLYRVLIGENEIQLIKSEDYFDDVYNLALEDIMDALIVAYIGENNIEAVQYAY
jgi:hypothetical protein